MAEDTIDSILEQEKNDPKLFEKYLKSLLQAALSVKAADLLKKDKGPRCVALV